MFTATPHTIAAPVAEPGVLDIKLTGLQAVIVIHALRLLSGDDHVYVADLIEAQAYEQTRVHLP